MDKKKLIASIDALKEAVETESVEGLMEGIKALNIDTRSDSSGIVVLLKLCMVKYINSYVGNYGTTKIEREAEYGTTTTDTYEIINTELCRNKYNAMFSTIGKLYQAYKQIKQWQNGKD